MHWELACFLGKQGNEPSYRDLVFEVEDLK